MALSFFAVATQASALCADAQPEFLAFSKSAALIPFGMFAGANASSAPLDESVRGGFHLALQFGRRSCSRLLPVPKRKSKYSAREFFGSVFSNSWHLLIRVGVRRIVRRELRQGNNVVL